MLLFPVLLVGQIDPEELVNGVVNKLRDAGGLTFTAFVSHRDCYPDRTEEHELVADVAMTPGRIKTLVYNAGELKASMCADGSKVRELFDNTYYDYPQPEPYGTRDLYLIPNGCLIGGYLGSWVGAEAKRPGWYRQVLSQPQDEEAGWSLDWSRNSVYLDLRMDLARRVELSLSLSWRNVGGQPRMWFSFSRVVASPWRESHDGKRLFKIMDVHDLRMGPDHESGAFTRTSSRWERFRTWKREWVGENMLVSTMMMDVDADGSYTWWNQFLMDSARQWVCRFMSTQHRTDAEGKFRGIAGRVRTFMDETFGPVDDDVFILELPPGAQLAKCEPN